jgi:hypothetical protein
MRARGLPRAPDRLAPGRRGRRFPTRILVRLEHLSADERIVEETTGYAVVEKVGPGARTAILLDRRNDRAEARRS